MDKEIKYFRRLEWDNLTSDQQIEHNQKIYGISTTYMIKLKPFVPNALVGRSLR